MHIKDARSHASLVALLRLSIAPYLVYSRNLASVISLVRLLGKYKRLQKTSSHPPTIMSFLFPKIQLQKPTRDPDGAWNFFDGALKTWSVHNDGNSSTIRQLFKHSNPHTGNGRASTATPPYHWHIYQTERFDVKSGTLCYDLDGEIGKLQAGETATILPGRYHTFWPDPDVKADLDVHITVSGGPNKGLDDVFLVNFYGYLSSVTMRGESPNPLQMFAFLDHADVVLADFPLQTGRLANIILGRWIGRGLAGYQVEYKEFSEDSE